MHSIDSYDQCTAGCTLYPKLLKRTHSQEQTKIETHHVEVVPILFSASTNIAEISYSSAVGFEVDEEDYDSIVCDAFRQFHWIRRTFRGTYKISRDL